MEALDREEFTKRMGVLTTEEQEIVAQNISNEILISELNRRLADMADKINQLKDIFKLQ